MPGSCRRMDALEASQISKPREVVVRELTQLVLDECDKPMDVDAVDVDAPLLGPASPLALDSLDALQIAMAVKQRYGVQVPAGAGGRKALASINALADFISP